MVQRMSLQSQQEYYDFLRAAAVVAANYQHLLNNPSLQLSPGERGEHESDLRLLSGMLPEKVRSAIEAMPDVCERGWERTDRAHEEMEIPY